jgi:hypothetical protein
VQVMVVEVVGLVSEDTNTERKEKELINVEVVVIFRDPERRYIFIYQTSARLCVSHLHTHFDFLWSCNFCFCSRVSK